VPASIIGIRARPVIAMAIIAMGVRTPIIE
jgi:hypothetical protein